MTESWKDSMAGVNCGNPGCCHQLLHWAERIDEGTGIGWSSRVGNHREAKMAASAGGSTTSHLGNLGKSHSSPVLVIEGCPSDAP
jgi:hypothetical protein